MQSRDLAARSERTTEQEPRSFAKNADGATPARILIVEDDYLVANELEATLVEAGFHIVGVASNADQAIRFARAQRPDLAVVDVRLIGARDGVDAAIVMFTELGIRSIFASAHDDPDTRERAKAASPIAWLGKPYTAVRLLPLIRSALSPR
jgi:DNA-binding NarL/FixJ family response regulator